MENQKNNISNEPTTNVDGADPAAREHEDEQELNRPLRNHEESRSIDTGCPLALDDDRQNEEGDDGNPSSAAPARQGTPFPFSQTETPLFCIVSSCSLPNEAGFQPEGNDEAANPVERSFDGIIAEERDEDPDVYAEMDTMPSRFCSLSERLLDILGFPSMLLIRVPPSSSREDEMADPDPEINQDVGEQQEGNHAVQNQVIDVEEEPEDAGVQINDQDMPACAGQKSISLYTFLAPQPTNSNENQVENVASDLSLNADDNTDETLIQPLRQMQLLLHQNQMLLNALRNYQTMERILSSRSHGRRRCHFLTSEPTSSSSSDDESFGTNCVLVNHGNSRIVLRRAVSTTPSPRQQPNRRRRRAGIEIPDHEAKLTLAECLKNLENNDGANTSQEQEKTGEDNVERKLNETEERPENTEENSGFSSAKKGEDLFKESNEEPSLEMNAELTASDPTSAGPGIVPPVPLQTAKPLPTLPVSTNKLSFARKRKGKKATSQCNDAGRRSKASSSKKCKKTDSQTMAWSDVDIGQPSTPLSGGNTSSDKIAFTQQMTSAAANSSSDSASSLTASKSKISSEKEKNA